jgi:hypothetical protein
VDVIYNPEFYRLITKYKIPVFFKSAPQSLFSQGFVDNGRQVIELKSDEQLSRDSLRAHERNQSINSLVYDEMQQQ